MDTGKKFLIAVDDNEISMRAVDYVGQIVGSTEGFTICLFNVYPEPPPYYFQQGHTLAEYIREKEAAAEKIFARAREKLAGFAIPAERITTICRQSAAEPPSRTIIKMQEEGGFDTVVVGKRGVSKAEEFLFGSISNAVVRESKGFTVWVVG
ncbi:MAG: universal stress protein [Desulfobacterales bacterium]|nr:universal stress protein [Desulfobacterales bacterium]